MIVFDLCCPTGHRFEGWFGSSEDFAGQCERGLVTCPECGSPEIAKAPMAPAVPKKGNQQSPAKPAAMASGPPTPEMVETMKKMATMQAEMLKSSEYVGERFADESRAMHYGERDAKTIHGQATMEEAKKLHDEGIAVAPLPFPVAPPKAIN